VLAFAALYGCSATPANENGELPEDLAELKTLRESLEKEMRANQKQLDAIKARIKELDPTMIKSKKLVTTEMVSESDFRKFATLQGIVESKDLLTVSTETPGRLLSVLVDEGDPVRRGQLLATIDMEGIQKQREEVETSLSLAKDIYKRQERLWDQNIGSEIQYLEAKNSVDRLEKSLETLDEQLSKSKIYAPMSGVVDMVNLKTGEMAQPGVPIVTVLNTRNLKIVADIPESYLGKVSKGEKINVYFPALDKEQELTVSLIGRKIDPTNRTFKIEANISAANGLIKPNLLAEVRITEKVVSDVIVLSQELVQEEVGGRQYVMTTGDTPDGPVAEKTYVRTGDSYEGEVVIASGLEIGQQVIINGSRGLAPGEAIEIVQGDLFENVNEKADFITWIASFIRFMPTVLAYATEKQAYFNLFMESCRRFCIEPVILGWGEEWEGTCKKLISIYEYIREFPKYRFLLKSVRFLLHENSIYDRAILDLLASWPQAASMSLPLLLRTFTINPLLSR